MSVPSIEQNNIQSYNNIANQFSDKRFKPWDWIDKFITSKSEGSDILDIGCGNGRNMEYSNYNFTGVDNCKEFISICTNKNLNAIECDMTSLPFETNSFDSIISIASFHHLANHDRRELAVKEMSRVLKNDGNILLSVWSKDQSHNKKLNFTYGDNYVPWKNKDGTIKEMRYYYIFQDTELEALLQKYFTIYSKRWIHGNDVYILHK
uniref:Methyltransferase domain protein n=1 Tax=Megaviridae environmental sample TaxID=1737588 RepID=A0A5J6VJR4_9VIRU|nr:MAG: methyltransferase domain protein [Megaviridae environmental sample]